jgi:hypothetical protein
MNLIHHRTCFPFSWLWPATLKELGIHPRHMIYAGESICTFSQHLTENWFQDLPTSPHISQVPQRDVSPRSIHLLGYRRSYKCLCFNLTCCFSSVRQSLPLFDMNLVYSDPTTSLEWAAAGLELLLRIRRRGELQMECSWRVQELITTWPEGLDNSLHFSPLFIASVDMYWCGILTNIFYNLPPTVHLP